MRLVLALAVSQILLFFLSLFFLGALVGSRTTPPLVHAHSALSIRLQGDLIEYPTLPNIALLHDTPVSQAAILEGLDRAASDSHLDAVLLDLEGGSLGWGKAAELRGALRRFRESGKQVWAYSSVLDEVGLYVASACDSVFLPPYGKLSLNGMALASVHYKGTLDKIGVRANMYRIGAYKSAPEEYTRAGMSEEARRQASWLLDEIWEEFEHGVTESRQLDRGALESTIAAGTLQPEEALAAGLIDGIRARQDLVARFGFEDGKPKLVPVETYHRTASRAEAGAKRAIAVVHARGMILRGRNTFDPLFGTILGEASVVRDLQQATEDDGVAAIVLRIDSPGGEMVASDVIGHAVERAKRMKPVVVSMVDVAASGGYMMAYRASRILALPTTITGSIGMFSGKFNAHDLYTKLGISKDFVTRGEYPFLYSDYHDWSTKEESLVVRQHQQDYRHWIESIAQLRSTTPDSIDGVAQGRVWTGQQALARHLVDEIGDQARAVDVAKKLVGLPSDAPVRLVHYPKQRGLLDLIEERESLLASALERTLRAARVPRDLTWSVLDLQVEP